MTKGKKFKKRIRARQAETGESYSRARKAEDDQSQPQSQPQTAFWYYYETEYPDEGSVFPFSTQREAEQHAGGIEGLTFGERKATEEEESLIDFGKLTVLKVTGGPRSN